jgi:hypothetical protein
MQKLLWLPIGNLGAKLNGINSAATVEVTPQKKTLLF